MKVSCILTSYNRPIWVRYAIESVASQTHRDFELILVDESDLFNIDDKLSSFRFPVLKVVKERVLPEERRKTNRLSVNINKALKLASGELVCYLADDDFLLPGWFQGASDFFRARSDVNCAYGRLFYTHDRGSTFDRNGKCRFPGRPVPDPYCVLDHNQVVHRLRRGIPEWPEDPSTIGGPDAVFFRSLARIYGAFYPINVDAAVKRVHEKNLQKQVGEYIKGSLPRERE